jgi:hypothetical protein
MSAAIVSGESCIVLYIDAPPFGLGANRLMVGRANVIAAPNIKDGSPREGAINSG